MSTPPWLAPLASALAGIAGGGVGVSWMQRGRTAAEAQLNLAEADHKHAEAESLTVQTIQNALVTVERLSAGKDAQLAAIREEQVAQAQKHADEVHGLRTEIQALTAQLALVAQSLSAHGQWDLYVLAYVRQTMPEFPDPPPLGFLNDIASAANDEGGQAT